MSSVKMGDETPLFEEAVRVVRILREAGFDALFAGGCVRDLCMEVQPLDYDIATSARPGNVQKLFAHTVSVGAQFGVVRVLSGGCEFEVATFRGEGPYSDGRHPDTVWFASAKQDAQRRDFTINGMFWDPLDNRIIDYVGGMEDLRGCVVRAIGNAEERFMEDRLRLLRAIRFGASLNFQIEDSTKKALCALAARINEVSVERIRDELLKMLASPRRGQAVKLLQETGLLAAVLPEVDATVGVPQPPQFHPEGDVFIHTVLTLDYLETASPIAAFAALLHDVGKPPTLRYAERIRFDEHSSVGARMADEICRRLRFSNDEREEVVAIVAGHLRFMHVKEMRASKLKRFIRRPHFEEELALHRADCLASHGDLENWQFCVEKLAEFEPLDVRPPRFVTGNDLIVLGYARGPIYRTILNAVEDRQLEGKIRTREEALTWIQRKFPVSRQQGSG